MYKFEEKPKQELRRTGQGMPQQQVCGGAAYAAMRQMSSLMGNQAMLAMMRSSSQSQSNETPFSSQMRERFELPQRPITQSKAPEQTSVGGASLPDYLREKFEKKSGLLMDDVRVHYNSDKPERLGALAYTQGTDVYVGPGQEKHLEHELGHVVQQKQGEVTVKHHRYGLDLNDDPQLEHEADQGNTKFIKNKFSRNKTSQVIQCCRERKRLLLGEEDFSFSHAKIKKNPNVAGTITATSYEQVPDNEHTFALQQAGATISGNVDATKLSSRYSANQFTDIYFHYPRGKRGRTRLLLERFAAEAYKILPGGGMLHVSLPRGRTYRVSLNGNSRTKMQARATRNLIYGRGKNPKDIFLNAGFEFVKGKEDIQERYRNLGYRHRITGRNFSRKGLVGREYIYKKKMN